MQFVREGVNFGGKELTIETGRMAKQADGSVVVRYGDTMVLVTAVARRRAPGRRLLAADRRVPGEDLRGRQDPRRLLQARGPPDRGRDADLPPHRSPVAPAVPQGLALRHPDHRDRASRPTRRTRPTCWRMTGASAALHISDIPWAGPFAGVRVGRIDGKFVVNPTFARARAVRPRPHGRRQPRRDRDGRGRRGRGRRRRHHRRADVRAQGGAAAHRPAGEAARRGRQAEARVHRRRPRIRRSSRKVARAGRRRRSRPPWRSATSSERYGGAGRRWRRGSRQRSAPRCSPDRGRRESSRPFESAKKKHLRELVLDTGTPHRRPRAPTDIRADHLRGRRAAAHARLGAVHPRRDPGAGRRPRSAPSQDEQHIDALIGDVEKRFMLHYNFPPFSTGETKPLRGAGRREIGHGALAERALARMLPEREGLPVHDPHRLGDPRVERQLVDGLGLRRHAGADGRGRADQGAGRRHRDGPHQGRRPRRHPVRHPRRRGSPRRHGLQGLRHEAGHHRHPDGHQDPGPDARDPRAGARPGAGRPPPHPRQDGRGAAGAARRAVAATRRASTRCRSSPTRSATSSARAARPSAASSRRPASPSTSRTTARCTSRRPTAIAVKKAIDIIKGLTTEPEVGKIYRASSSASPSSAPSSRSSRAPTASSTSASSTHKRVQHGGGRLQGRRRGDGEGHRHRSRRARSGCRARKRSARRRTSSTTSAPRPRRNRDAQVTGVRVRFQRLRPGALAPRYMTAGAAGLDLASAADEAMTLLPGRASPCPRGWRSRSRPASRGRCGRARGWRARQASRCPTRRGRSTATTAARCWCCWSTWARSRTSSSRATASRSW